MVRAPCCEKMGLKRGPWTAEEDKTLISYIQEYGHGNWRALPKQAGLLRCGKSCRLRWTNYLRPDIKRGNFSKDEEETIIKLHEMLGNRWSTIAARLPGRTDNEIKNVWHTHLKKRLKQTTVIRETKQQQQQQIETPKQEPEIITGETKFENSSPNAQEVESSGNSPVSPQPSSSSGFSSGMESSIVTGSENQEIGIKDEYMESSETFPKIDESFWLQAWPTDINFGTVEDLNENNSTKPRNNQFPESTVSTNTMADDMDFWYNLFMGAGELTELPEL